MYEVSWQSVVQGLPWFPSKVFVWEAFQLFNYFVLKTLNAGDSQKNSIQFLLYLSLIIFMN